MATDSIRNLEEAISAIELLDRAGCLDHWRKAFGRSPPKYLSPQFMKRVLIGSIDCYIGEAETRLRDDDFI